MAIAQWIAGARTLTGTLAAGIDISQSKGWPLMWKGFG